MSPASRALLHVRSRKHTQRHRARRPLLPGSAHGAPCHPLLISLCFIVPVLPGRSTPLQRARPSVVHRDERQALADHQPLVATRQDCTSATAAARAAQSFRQRAWSMHSTRCAIVLHLSHANALVARWLVCRHVKLVQHPRSSQS